MGEPAVTPLFHLALLQPEIPGNTGNIGRLCLGLGLRLHLVPPLGFRTDEKAVRRAGIDHWAHVDLVEHPDEAAFWRWAAARRTHLLSARGTRPYTEIPWQPGDVVVFGRESVGLSDELVARHSAWYIPVRDPVRSLNLSNAAAVVAYDGARTLLGDRFVGDR